MPGIVFGAFLQCTNHEIQSEEVLAPNVPFKELIVGDGEKRLFFDNDLCISTRKGSYCNPIFCGSAQTPIVKTSHLGKERGRYTAARRLAREVPRS